MCIEGVLIKRYGSFNVYYKHQNTTKIRSPVVWRRSTTGKNLTSFESLIWLTNPITGLFVPHSPGAEGGHVCNHMSPNFDSWSM